MLRPETERLGGPVAVPCAGTIKPMAQMAS
jgi:hypothetical protein